MKAPQKKQEVKLTVRYDYVELDEDDDIVENMTQMKKYTETNTPDLVNL